MAIGPRLDLRQSQSLVMTPQLRQAIKLLQFSNIEVGAFIEEELERNPLLERDDGGEPAGILELPALDQRERVVVAESEAAPVAGEREYSDPNVADVGTTLEAGITTQATAALDAEGAESWDPGGAGDGVMQRGSAGGSFDDDDRSIDDLAERPGTLREHLSEQLRLSFNDDRDRLIGAYLIALLEPTGRLSAAPEALAQALGCDVAVVESVRTRMMRFDPTGMFARDLRECLAVQLQEKNRYDPAMAALLDNLEMLARRDTRGLMAVCGVDQADITDMIAELRRLDPKPGATWNEQPPLAVVPDILMRAAQDGGWFLELNPETLPRVLVNQSFTARVLPRASRDDRAFLAEKLQTANWLVKSLQQRAQTILKVASEIVRRQDGFFRHGVSHLRPLILRDIAEASEMHESTVSRVTSNKYMATPRGTFELKYFFTTAIAGTGGGESHSAEAIRHRIKAMVDSETAEDILSDDAIVAALRREGVDIARRTVAKYRDALRIPSSVQRKREKAMPA
jgi:RNA polymerase sigma-54 factor